MPVAAAATLLVAISSARAQTNWMGGDSSDWFTAGNWSAGVPNSATTATLDTVTPNPTVVEGGTASAESVAIAVNSGSAGMLTVSSNGTLATTGISGGSGTSTLTLDGGTLRALDNNPAFISNLPGVALGAGGGTIDSNGFNIAIGVPFTGTGGLTKAGSGTLTLTGPNSYSGDTTVSGGTLAAGTANTLSFSSSVDVMSGATLNLDGFSQRVNNFTNAGTVQLGVPGVTPPGTVLNVSGGYVGQGGNVLLNTELGPDNSRSDLLNVGTTATGTTTLHITNVGGAGAETTGNGILVVQAASTGITGPNTFILPPNTELRAGAFDYRLFHGTLLNPAVLPEDWFLRSSMLGMNGGSGGPEVEPEEPLPETPANEEEKEQPDKDPPIIGPELADYGVVQPIARELGLTMLGTLHERIGDTMTVENAGTGPQGLAQSAWGRFFGEQIDNSYRAFAAPNADGRIFGLQAGLDLLRFSSLPDHRDAMGLYFAYGNANLDVSGLVTNAAATGFVRSRAGTLGLNGYSVGGYWTHYGPGGWYLDGVVQGTFYGGSADTQFSRLPTDGAGAIISLEAGYPVALPVLGPRFILEPQAQILWQHVNFDQAFDGTEQIGLGTTSGAAGRLGIRGQWTIAGMNGEVWQPYARANFWRAWGGNAATSFGGQLVPLSDQATWGEVAGGLTFKHTQSLSYYGQFGYQFAITSRTGISGFIGDIGLRYTW